MQDLINELKEAVNEFDSLKHIYSVMNSQDVIDLLNRLIGKLEKLNEKTVNEANRGFCECDDNPHRILMTLSKCAECGKIVED